MKSNQKLKFKRRRTLRRLNTLPENDQLVRK